MNFLRNLANPWGSVGENILPEEKKPHQKFRFSNRVEEQNFAFGNAPSNVRTMNTRNRRINNRKNTRKLFTRPTLLTPRTKSQARQNIRNYGNEIERQRNQNNLKRIGVNRGRNVASSRNPSGEQWLRERQPQFKFPAGILGYSNTVNNLTRKAYKPISNLSQKQAQNWARKVHTNEVFGR